jgi:hypothetical protein
VAPEVVGAAGDALGQEPLRALHVLGPEAGLQQRVVEDVALGAAAAELDEARAQRLELRDGPA